MVKAASGKRGAAVCASVSVDMASDGAPAGEAPPTPPPLAEKPAAGDAAPLLARNKGALLAVGFAVTVGVSACVAALVASAVVAGAREERPAAAMAPSLSSRRLEPAVANASSDAFCLDASKGELCHRLVTWIMEDGPRFDPGKYVGMNHSTPFHEAQAVAHTHYPDLCPPPCGKAPPDVAPAGPSAESAHELINCDYGHDDSKPAHAGCFVVHEGKLLAERLTYDREKFDIPGGQTNWNEPARCTAYRETYEETGYLVAPRELLAVVRNDFHLYRCELLRPQPLKGHDHEISWVGWMDASEVDAKVSQHMWRFPEAHQYAGWLR